MSQRRGAMRRLLGAAKGVTEEAPRNIPQLQVDEPTTDQNQPQWDNNRRSDGVVLLRDTEKSDPLQ